MSDPVLQNPAARLSRGAMTALAAGVCAVLATMASASAASAHVARPGVRAVCQATAATFYHPGHALYAHCDALIRTGVRTDTPSGYGPADFQAAYKLTAASKQRGKGQTVAIVDAYNDPDAASNLATYRKYYKLPACTAASGCFKQVSQNGKASPLPAGNTSWGTEESLDVDMISAICPNCHIILIEASSSSFKSLGTAEDEAAKLGADVISNSWGASSDAPDSTYGKYFNHPGHAVTFSGGDSGYGPHYPATSQYVTAVEGTELTKASGSKRGWDEVVWSGTGSGCSKYNTKPSWQKAASVKDTACAKRTMGDVAADADPSTGAAIYDTYGQDGWLQVGGDSEASPTVAGVYALAGNGTKVTYGSYPYAHTSDLFDVTKGSNGTCTPPKADKYLCTARVGYDGPSGLGTPDGYQGF
jgi:subtilase family serine protease